MSTLIKIERQTAILRITEKRSELRSTQTSQNMLKKTSPEKRLLKSTQVNKVIVQENVSVTLKKSERPNRTIRIFDTVRLVGDGMSSKAEAIDFSARDSVSRNIVYVAWSSAPKGSEDPTNAEWKIGQYDSVAAVINLLYADGSLAYDKILNSGGLTPEYEDYSYS